MVNFDYCTPTRLIFGKGSAEQLPKLLAQYGRRVLLVYGGGSIKKIGLYDKIKLLLQRDFDIFELSGVEPNPKLSSVEKGAELCRENGVQVVLAVGGGSVLDCAKSICACAANDGDCWDIITKKVRTVRALPLVDIITLSATGSEYDANSVISRPETNDKLCLKSEHIFPKISILDPVYTFSVSKLQTAAGAADAMSHVMEKYFTGPVSLLADGMCEAVLKSLMTNVKLALEDPEDYDARSELMVSCALACNNIIALGNGASGWVCHSLEHALSAFYDITHGVGLAIVTPRWMRKILEKYPEKTAPRLAKFGVNIFGLDKGLPEDELAQKAIDELYGFFKSIGLPMNLKAVGIDETRIDEMSRHIFETEGVDGAWAALSEEDVREILTNSL